MGTLTLNITLAPVAVDPAHPDGIHYSVTADPGPYASALKSADGTLNFSELSEQTIDIDFDIATTWLSYPTGSPAVSVTWPSNPSDGITIRLGPNQPVAGASEFVCSSISPTSLMVADADNDGKDYYYALNFVLGTPTPKQVSYDPEIQNHPQS